MAALHDIVPATLVPARGPNQPPPGTTLVEQRLRGGIPALVPLTTRFSLAVALPSGLAATWRDTDPTALVTAGRFERGQPPAEAWPTGLAAASRPPLLLVLLDTTATSATGSSTKRPVAATIATAGVPRRLSANDGPDDRRAAVAVTMLDWELHAGTVVGAGDHGSWVRFAWRAVGAGSDSFDTPPIHPRLRARQPHAGATTGTGPAAADAAGYAPTPASTTWREWV
jgi:hypothetical protein